MKNVVVVDYGMGNIKSIQRGLSQVGVSAILSSDPEVIAVAGRLILPGVGAFNHGMKGLEDADLIVAIYEFVKTGNPLLGICLGMQMLLDQSDEYGNRQGLGLIPGAVRAIPRYDGSQYVRKTPHIGWSELKLSAHQNDWLGTCLEDIKYGEYFYFVHSYMAMLKDKADLLAHCEYEELSITAAIRRDNITGLQFHPEKSGKFGLKILQRFVGK